MRHQRRVGGFNLVDVACVHLPRLRQRQGLTQADFLARHVRYRLRTGGMSPHLYAPLPAGRRIRRHTGCAIPTIPRGVHMATKYSKAAAAKVEKVMRERKAGTLRSGRSGKKVTSRKQAIAIGLSEARAAGKRVPKKSRRSS